MELEEELKTRFAPGSSAQVSETEWNAVVDAVSRRYFFFRILRGLLPPDFPFQRIFVQFLQAGGARLVSVNIHAPESEQHGRAQNWLSLRLNLQRIPRSRLEAVVPRMDVHGLQGGAKKVFHNLLPLFREIGVDRITLDAAEVGSYAWVRYGFRPDRREWKRLRSELLARLAKLAEVPGLAGGRAKRREIERILSRSDPEAIRALADLDDASFPAPGRLGFRLLNGATWHGALDLTNGDAVNELKRYIGYQPDRVWAERSVAGPALEWAQIGASVDAAPYRP
jgi:hypothetical protein